MSFRQSLSDLLYDGISVTSLLAGTILPFLATLTAAWVGIPTTPRTVRPPLHIFMALVSVLAFLSTCLSAVTIVRVGRLRADLSEHGSRTDETTCAHADPKRPTDQHCTPRSGPHENTGTEKEFTALNPDERATAWPQTGDQYSRW
jgi:hypothetical protein